MLIICTYRQNNAFVIVSAFYLSSLMKSAILLCAPTYLASVAPIVIDIARSHLFDPATEQAIR